MPQDDRSSYVDKQKRQAVPTERGYSRTGTHEYSDARPSIAQPDPYFTITIVRVCTNEPAVIL
jgi:hypothetical protein